jgi:hypothetical protein
MKKLIYLTILFSFLLSCEKSSDNVNSFIMARIVGFDPNCTTCILEFPYDNLQVSEEMGRSPNSYYRAVNMSRTSYEVGQMLKVKIRRPEHDEVLPCTEFNPSFNNDSPDLKNVYITSFENINNLIVGEKISLAINDCLYDPENLFYFCFDSVINDSRCPTGAYCFWEGNVTVRFSFKKFDSRPVVFDLNTHKGFTNDTIVSGYKISLLNLNPYPALNHKINQDDYKAEILIEKNR